MSQNLKHMTWSFKKGKIIINKRDGSHMSLNMREQAELIDVLDDIRKGNNKYYTNDSRND